MKKTITLLLAAALILSLAACSGGNDENGGTPSNSGITEQDQSMITQTVQAALNEVNTYNENNAGKYKHLYSDMLSATEFTVFKYDSTTMIYTQLENYAENILVLSKFNGDSIIETQTSIDVTKLQALLDEIPKDIKGKQYKANADILSNTGLVPYDEMKNTLEELALKHAGDYMLTYAQSKLKNPFTLEIHSAYAYMSPPIEGTKNNLFFLTITYSSENSVGGRVTTTIGNTTSGMTLGQMPTQNLEFIFVEDGTKASKEDKGFKLDSEQIQAFVLDNLK